MTLKHAKTTSFGLLSDGGTWQERDQEALSEALEALGDDYGIVPPVSSPVDSESD